MSEPSKKPSKDREREKWKKVVDLPDDEAIRKLFPKKVVEEINREIDHKPSKPPRQDQG